MFHGSLKMTSIYTYIEREKERDIVREKERERKKERIVELRQK